MADDAHDLRDLAAAWRWAWNELRSAQGHTRLQWRGMRPLLDGMSLSQLARPALG